MATKEVQYHNVGKESYSLRVMASMVMGVLGISTVPGV